MSSRIYLLLFAASSLLAVYGAFFALDPLQQRDWLPDYLVYPLVLGSVIFISSLIPWLHDALRQVQIQRRHLLVALAILLAWLFLISREPPGFKILQDEYVLSATAMNVHYNRSASVPSRGYWIDNNYLILDGYLDKRPLFFPFLLATVHDVLGYDVNNVFVLNALITLLLLWLSYLLARRLGNSTHGALLVILGLASVPLLAQNAVGGGFELLNVCMLLLTLLLGMEFARQPDARSLTAFCYAAFFLAQTRYESSVFVLCTGALVIWVWWRERRIILSTAVILLPLLFILPMLALQAVVLDRFWMQLADDQPSAFSLGFIPQHLGNAIEYLFIFNQNSSMNPITSALAVFGLFYFAYHIRLTLNRENNIIFMLFIIMVIINLFLLMSYYWGDMKDFNARRLILPALVISIICLPTFISTSQNKYSLYFLTAILILGFISVTVPYTNRHAYSKASFLPAEDSWAIRYLQDIGDIEKTLVISRDIPLFILNKINVITTDRAIQQAENINHAFSHQIYKPYVYQQYFINPDNATFEFISRSDLHEQFTLNTLIEHNFSAYIYSRISEVSAIKPANGLTSLDYQDYAYELRTGVANFPRITPENHQTWLKQFP